MAPQAYYECTRCGNCCRWPGYVRVHEDEVVAIAAHLGLTPETFTRTYTRLMAGRKQLSLTEQEDGACIFLRGRNVCAINAVKPRQCTGFPNVWNFPGFQEHCESIPVTDPEAIARLQAAERT